MQGCWPVGPPLAASTNTVPAPAACCNLHRLRLCAEAPASTSQHPPAPALAFFQLDTQGGIFQSCWSLTVSGRGGECMTGTGGEPGPRGTCNRRQITGRQAE